MFEVSGRYSASKLMASLPQPGHKRKFNTSNMQSLERLLHIAKQALETDYRSWGDSCV